MDIVRGFQWQVLRRDQLEDGELPKKVFIQFDDPTIGHSLKEFNGWVGISLISVVYQGNKGYGNVERIMLLIILTLRLYIGSFWEQPKFSSQITFKIKKSGAWLLSLKNLGIRENS